MQQNFTNMEMQLTSSGILLVTSTKLKGPLMVHLTWFRSTNQDIIRLKYYYITTADRTNDDNGSSCGVHL